MKTTKEARELLKAAMVGRSGDSKDKYVMLLVEDIDTLETRLEEYRKLLERAMSALNLADIKDCSPCPNSSPAPIEECQLCRWAEFVRSIDADYNALMEKKG